MSKNSNVAVVDGKIVLRYMGFDAKDMILHIAKWVLLQCWGSKLRHTNSEDDFILNQTRNIATFYNLCCSNKMPLSVEEKEFLINVLVVVSERYNINSYSDILEKYSDEVKKRCLMNNFTTKLSFILKDEGISVKRLDSNTSSSIYLTLDNKVLKSIRISDHVSTKVVPYNILFFQNSESIVNAKDKKGKTTITFSISPNTNLDAIVEHVVELVKLDKKEKIAKFGEEAYKKQSLENKKYLGNFKYKVI